MKHIKEEYGMSCNLLELTHDEYKELKPFLLALGIKTRSVRSDREKVVIQGKNPYEIWINEDRRKIAEEDFAELSLSCYER